MLSSPRTALRRRLADEQGSTLLMYPFAVIIVIILGSLAVDTAIVFQAHRQAVDVSAGLASDIAGVVDEAAFATEGAIRIDRARAADILRYTNDTALAGDPSDLRCRIVTITDDPASVTVACAGTASGALLDSEFARVGITGTATASPTEQG